MSLFNLLISEARKEVSEDPVGSAMAKFSKARGEMSYARQDRRTLASGAKGSRAVASNRLNTAQRRLGKAMASNPEEDYDPDETTPGEAEVGSAIGKAAGSELGPVGSWVGGKIGKAVVPAFKKYTLGGKLYTAVRQKMSQGQGSED